MRPYVCMRLTMFKDSNYNQSLLEPKSMPNIFDYYSHASLNSCTFQPITACASYDLYK